MSPSAYMGRFVRPLGVCLLALGLITTACTTSAPERQPSPPVASKQVGAPGSPNTGQLVLSLGDQYVRWTPGSRPQPILPVKRMSALDLASAGHRLYWLQGYRGRVFATAIRSASDTGRHPITLSPNVGAAVGLAATRTHVYWGSPRAIGRLSVDGGQVERRWLVLPPTPSGDIQSGMATDGRYLYLSQCDNGRIGRVPLSAENPEASVEWIIHTDTCPQDLAVSGGYLYWSGNTHGGRGVIGRATIDGAAPDATWAQPRTNAIYLAVADGFIYWQWCVCGFRGAPSFLGRIGLDGTKFTRKVRTIGAGPIAATAS